MLRTPSVLARTFVALGTTLGALGFTAAIGTSDVEQQVGQASRSARVSKVE
jgi:hypothetical protein